MITQTLRHKAVASATAFLLLWLADAGTSRTQAAAQFSVEPVLLTLPADKLATSMSLGNNGTKAVTVQAELLTWDQAEGPDRYGPVEDLLVSPPIFSIAPGATQVIRVGRLKKTTAPAKEIAFRLRLAEIPPDGPRDLGAVTTVMQLSFPIFVSPTGKPEPSQIKVVPAAAIGEDLQLAVSNSGRVHDKLISLILKQDGKAVAERSLNYYVLAGATRQLNWSQALKNAKPGAAQLEIKLATRKILTVPLVVEAPPAPLPAE